MIDLMKQFLLSGLVAAAALSVFAPSARADFASCVGSLRAQAAHGGISAKALDIAFNGLEPDTKVLDLQKQQPEFKTPVWDYVDGLVDDEIGSPTARPRWQQVAARACPRRRAIWREPHHAGGDLGSGVEFRPGDGKAPAAPVADDAFLPQRSRQLFSLRN